MPKNLTMPRLSDTMEVGTIVKWHAKPGQKVKAGDVLADIETDKATMEMQTFEDGVIAALNVNEGQAVPVGTLILSWDGGVGGAEVKGGAKPAAAAASVGGSNSVGTATATAVATISTSAGDRVFASPLARKIAADSGVDLTQIEGTGPSGRVVRKDVESFIARGSGARSTSNGFHAPAPISATPAPAAARAGAPVPASPIAAGTVPGSAFTLVGSPLTRQTVALSNMRRTIATRLVESKTTIPHYQVTLAVRMDNLVALRQQLNDQLAAQGVKLSVNDFIVRACALGMHQHPYVNSRWIGTKGAESIELLDTVNVGVAISLPAEKGGGLVVATIRQADQKGLRLISSETKALAEKARTKGLTIDEMGDSTFTISNLGMFGVEHFTAIINPPNAAILAVGAAVKKPVVVTRNGVDTLEIGHEMQMTISSDHRIVDGAMAAAYLSSVKQMLETPATLLV
ncbi:MAG: 2-oxo acid dehydrogenase subunit E2 [Phycisphaerales bacterium]|nr:2-oxo acid dehydrogenase subunit E2 [Phycisphaerales bacterium]